MDYVTVYTLSHLYDVLTTMPSVNTMLSYLLRTYYNNQLLSYL